MLLLCVDEWQLFGGRLDSRSNLNFRRAPGCGLDWSSVDSCNGTDFRTANAVLSGSTRRLFASASSVRSLWVLWVASEEYFEIV